MKLKTPGMGIKHKQCIGIHINTVSAFPKLTYPLHIVQAIACLFQIRTLSWLIGLSQIEAEQVANNYHFLLKETGYQWIQATKPLTLAYSLQNSPTGLLAWILEKFEGWSHGGISKFSKEAILSNVMIYLYSGKISSSMYIYKEHLATAELFKFGTNYCPVPTACLVSPNDIIWSPLGWASARMNVVRYTRGTSGHFAAMENPSEFSKDLLEFNSDISEYLLLKNLSYTKSYYEIFSEIVFGYIPFVIACLLLYRMFY